MMVKTVVDRFEDLGKEILDAFIAETNLFKGKILSESNLGSCSQLETYQS